MPDSPLKKRKESDAMMKKTMAMFALLIIALSVVGFAYSTWKDEVQIEGTIHMGEFIVGMKDIVVQEQPEDKPVGSVTYKASDNETSKHHIPAETVYKLLEVNISAGYPSYGVWINFTLKNAGTIPATINALNLYGLNCTDYWLPWNGTDFLEWNGTAWNPVINFNVKWYNGTAWLDLEDMWGLQIEPCTGVPVSIKLHIKEDAKECCTYKFYIYIEAVQWNEWPAF